MHAKNSIVDKGCDWQHVEGSGELLPESDVVALLTLFVEAIYFSDVFTFVIPAQKENCFGELNLVREQKAY